MNNKYLKITLISVAIVIVIIALIFAFKPSNRATEKAAPPVPKTTTEKTTTPASGNSVKKEASLQPLPSDTKAAVDSEMKVIDTELNSLSDESLDDLSGIENEL